MEVDSTYSNGNFYKNGKIPQPKYKFDKYLILEDVEKFEDRLPFPNNSIKSIMFDPPFIIACGPSIKKEKNKGNAIQQRFHNFNT